MSATESRPTTATLTIDGREVTVPIGTPLVVAAAEAAGVEIPVFCYEPRLGAPVGACRMCLVEVEMNGRPMPKLQAACTMTVADGMVVRSAHTSKQAEEGQDAVLEFLLLNHPLDCPVCDKGGECPLQDLVFRYGPGRTRMTLPKRTYEKPLPISGSIVLDRERCILCYRCTRFSSDVAEDGELIARERGARSVIATFEERPYEGVFSGNVTELCPVGALLPVAYRFKARPWEIVNVPSTCTLCPTGCSTWATVREGKVERILSRNNAEVDEGWLCDKGRFARHEPLEERIAAPLVRGDAGLAPGAWDEVLTTLGHRLRHVASLHGPGAVAVVAGGGLTNEEALVWSEIAASLEARVAASPVAHAGAWERLAPYEARIADLERADLIVVIGDAEPVDRAGVVDLRIRKGRRAGAHLAIVGPGGTRLERDCGSFTSTLPGRAAVTVAALAAAVRDAGGEGVRPRPASAQPAAGEASTVAELAALAGADADQIAALGARLAAAQRPVVLVTDDVNLAWVENLAWTAGLDAKDGGVLPLPRGANERGARAAGLVGGWDEVLAAAEAGDVRAIVFAGGADPVSETADGDRWAMALGGCEVVVAAAPFTNGVTTWSHAVLPQCVDAEREGTTTSLEGRVQRLRPAVKPPSGVTGLAWTTALARALGIADAPTSAARAFARLAASRPAFHGLAWGELEGAAALPAGRPEAADPPWPALVGSPAGDPAEGVYRLVAPRPLMSGAAVERTPWLAHQRRSHVVLAHEDALALGLEDGDIATVRHEQGAHAGTVVTSRRLRRGTVRIDWRGIPTGAGARIEKGAAR